MPGCRQSVPLQFAGPPKLKVGTVVWVGYAPFYVADALDLYKPYGLSVTTVLQ
jgi:NitT/TauT family transport system substrate-binding protein